MRMAIAAAILMGLSRAFAGAAVAPQVLSQDLCGYALDIHEYLGKGCGGISDPMSAALRREAERNAPARKDAVLRLARRLLDATTPDEVGAVLDDPLSRLEPPVNARTFRAWLPGPDGGKVQGIYDAQVRRLYEQWMEAGGREGSAGRATAPALGDHAAALGQRLESLGVHLSDPRNAADVMDGSRAYQARDLATTAETPGAPTAESVASPAAAAQPPQTPRSMGGLDSAKGPPPPVPDSPVSAVPLSIPPGSPWSYLIDPTADPCVDFYQYACGTWDKQHPLKGDSSFGRFDELQDRNTARLRTLLQEAASRTDAKDPDEKKVGDLFASCMDKNSIEAKGLEPLRSEFDRIGAMPDVSALAGEVAHLQTVGVSVLIGFGPEPDPKNSSRNMASAAQGKLTLPRDYYLNGQFSEERKAYAGYAAKMFAMAGDPRAQAAAEAQAVLRLETALAEISMSREEMRDPANLYHKMELSDFGRITPSFDWARYAAGVGAPSFTDLDVNTPEYFTGLEVLLRSVPLGDWKTYLRWKVLDQWAPLLPSKFVKENFNFYGRKLEGQKRMDPRWVQCSGMSDALMGDAVGKMYVERFFKDKDKASTQRMVQELEKAMGDDIRSVPWMTEETKTQALDKLAGITNKVGYPETWQDYGAFAVRRDDALGNAQRAVAFQLRRDMGKIGRPTDKKEWGMTPPTVNAYYSPQDNTINFPAGILQPPFFNGKGDAARNFGAIGVVIGHEITHGFDDEGRRFDAQGNMRDWWTPADDKAFKDRAQCFQDQYSQFTAVKDPKDASKDIKVNGRVTLGENLADNGGIRIAYRAMEAALSGAGRVVDGFTPEQRFFLGFASVWCGNMSPQEAKERSASDVHSPHPARVNGTVSNMPEFGKAFACKTGSPMARENACRAW